MEIAAGTDPERFGELANRYAPWMQRYFDGLAGADVPVVIVHDDIVGNADTRILLTGTKDDVRAGVERCMSQGGECPGFFMSVGNHIPPNTRVESALYYNQVTKRCAGVREDDRPGPQTWSRSLN